MCWAALDAGVRLAKEHTLEAPVDTWRETRSEVREAILREGYDSQLGAFMQAFGSQSLDASALMIPRIGFPLDEPGPRLTRLPGMRWHATEHPLRLLQTGCEQLAYRLRRRTAHSTVDPAILRKELQHRRLLVAHTV